jgi:hypothetical protein
MEDQDKYEKTMKEKIKKNNHGIIDDTTKYKSYSENRTIKSGKTKKKERKIVKK